MDSKTARRNITLLLWFAALSAALLPMSVNNLFYQANGLNQTQIALVQAVYSAVLILLEVPNGSLADAQMHRLVLVFGAIISTMSYAVYGIAFGFLGMAIAEVIRAVGNSMISGADTALASDTIREAVVIPGEKPVPTYQRYRTLRKRYGFAGIGLAGFAGGLIADSLGLRATMLLQVFVYASLVPVALALREPEREQRIVKTRALSDAWRATKHAMHEHRQLRWLIIYNALVSTITYPVLWLAQPYYQSLGIPVVFFGVLSLSQYTSNFLFTFLVERLTRLRLTIVLVAYIVIGVVAYLLLGIWPSVVVLVVGLAGFSFIRATSEPILGELVDSEIGKGEMRTAIHSIQSAVSRIFGVIASMVFAVLTDVVSVRVAFMVAGGMFALGLAIFGFRPRAAASEQ